MNTADPAQRPLVVDASSHLVFVDGEPLGLNKLEFEVLSFLHEARGRVVPFRELAEKVWGFDHSGDLRFLYTSMWRLRKELARAGVHDLLQGRRGVGYIIPREHPSLWGSSGSLHSNVVLEPFRFDPPLLAGGEIERATGWTSEDHIRVTEDVLGFVTDPFALDELIQSTDAAARTGREIVTKDVPLRLADGCSVEADMVHSRLQGAAGRRLVLVQFVVAGAGARRSSPTSVFATGAPARIACVLLDN